MQSIIAIMALVMLAQSSVIMAVVIWRLFQAPNVNNLSEAQTGPRTPETGQGAPKGLTPDKRVVLMTEAREQALMQSMDEVPSEDGLD